MNAVAELAPEAALEELFPPLRLPRNFIPLDPTLKQEWFLRRNEFEVFFGGAAGPGKSWALLMAGLQYVDAPGYHALLLRPTLNEFEQQGGLIEVSTRWLAGTGAFWNGTKRQWTFPSGATLRFGYLRTLKDVGHYAGGGISFLGFDELTLFTERLYTSMFRLLRQPLEDGLENVPVRVRSASNPGNAGHVWVKGRFIEDETREPGAVFIPANIADNPHLDYATYLQTLSHLHPVDRARLISGDWDVTEEGGKFSRNDFALVAPASVRPAVRSVRYWDLAATKPSPANPDPDWTIGLRLELDDAGVFTVTSMKALRDADTEVEQLVHDTAVEDGRDVPVYIEQDPGQAGKSQLSNYQRRVLAGFQVYAGSTRIAGKPANKEIRARPVAAAVGNELVQVVATLPTLRLFLNQTSMFPMEGVHDDVVDALSGAHRALTEKYVGLTQMSSPAGTPLPPTSATDALRRASETLASYRI